MTAIMFPGNPDWQWTIAIGLWRQGDADTLVETIRRDVPRTQQATDFLAELAQGSAKRIPGRPHAQDLAARTWAVLTRFSALKAEGATKEDMLDRLSAEFHMSESSISQIVYPRRGSK